MNFFNLFVTKADKGGATLVMNYEDVQTAVRNELNKEDKFTQIQRTPEEQLAHVREEVSRNESRQRRCNIGNELRGCTNSGEKPIEQKR